LSRQKSATVDLEARVYRSIISGLEGTDSLVNHGGHREKLVGARLQSLRRGFPGCVTSENGLCSGDERGAVFDPSLLGEWVEMIPNSSPRPVDWVRSVKIERDRAESKAYRFTDGSATRGPEGAGVTAHKAYLVKLADTFFLDCFMDRQEGQPDHKLHVVMKIERPREGELRLCTLRSEYIKRHPNHLRHSVHKGSPFEFIEVTASTQEWIAFCRENGRNDEAWIKPGFT